MRIIFPFLVLLASPKEKRRFRLLIFSEELDHERIFSIENEFFEQIKACLNYFKNFFIEKYSERKQKNFGQSREMMNGR